MVWSGIFDKGDHRSPVGAIGAIGQKYTDPLAWIFGDKWVDLTSRKIPEMSNKALSKVTKPLGKIDRQINPARRIPIVDRVSGVIEDKPASAVGTAVGAFFAAPALAGAMGGGAGGAGGATIGGASAAPSAATTYPVLSGGPLTAASAPTYGGAASAGGGGLFSGFGSGQGGWMQNIQRINQLKGMLPQAGGQQNYADKARQDAEDRRRQALALALSSAGNIRRY